MADIRVKADGTKVVFVAPDGRAIVLPWEAAERLAQAMAHCAKVAEAEAKRDGIIAQQAVMLRTGAPFGLTNDAQVMAEAASMAQYDPALRRYLPGGIKSSVAFGTPAVLNHGLRRGKPAEESR